MEITYFGHSCFMVTLNGKKLLFDPFISGNPLAEGIDVSTIMPDFILVSHGHDDHIHDLVQIARQSNAVVVAAWEITAWLGEVHGYTNTHPMNIGGKWMFDFGKVKCVAAVHSSSFADGRYAGMPMGFIVESSEGNFYFAGDTALTYDMKLIGEYRSLDFALLPIGDNFTMSVDNAIIAADFINCRQIIGMHYDTFGYIKINHEGAKEKFRISGRNLVLMNIGQTINPLNQNG
jgi:L-ascorbate metabolism protein UlaG (beta-lactamase superfamily)